MGYNKKNTTLILIITIVSVLGLSIAFAAFSSTLTINSSAKVTPDASNFKVAFSTSASSIENGNVDSFSFGSAIGSPATISGTTISGLSVNLTKPGDAVMYMFYVYNAGSYDAILDFSNISISNATGATTFRKCTAGSETTKQLVEQACNDINLDLDIGTNNSNKAEEFGSISSNGNFYVLNTTERRINKGGYNGVILTISYENNSTHLADGPFTVDFGDITLTYKSH